MTYLLDSHVPLPEVQGQEIMRTMIMIEYPVVDDEGLELTCRTWSIGYDKKHALQRWQHHNHENVVPSSVVVVTPKHHGPIVNHADTGNRIKLVGE